MAISNKTLLYGGIGVGAVIVIVSIAHRAAAKPASTGSSGGGGNSGFGGIFNTLFGTATNQLNNMLGRLTGASFQGSSASDNSSNGITYNYPSYTPGDSVSFDDNGNVISPDSTYYVGPDAGGFDYGPLDAGGNF